MEEVLDGSVEGERIRSIMFDWSGEKGDDGVGDDEEEEVFRTVIDGTPAMSDQSIGVMLTTTMCLWHAENIR